MASSDYSIDLSELPRAMLDVATAAEDWFVILPVIVCMMASALLLLMRGSRGTQISFSLLALLGVGAMEFSLFWRVMAEGPIAMTMGNWLPPFGITFVVDVLAAGFALAATIVTAIVLIYHEMEINDREVKHGFHSLVLLLLAGVTGAFMTGDLFNLYVWFEVMLIATFGLFIIGGRKMQLDAAVKYGFLNFLATTFFLIGLGYLYGTVGTLNMADIARVAPVADPVAMTAIGGLFLLAFGMKAAAFPVNAWLPASYHTPDAAISALFGGLLTKVGAYALLRVMILMMPAAREQLDLVLTIVAVATLILGPMGAIAQTNLRRAIGFLVIGGIGSVIAGIAITGIFGVGGAAVYALHSMLTMTAFYLVAGLVEKVTGTDDARKMGGVYTSSSVISILFLILVFAAAGLPPFLGFWPKLLLLQGAQLEADNYLVAALLFNSILTSIAGARLWAFIFWRNNPNGTDTVELNPDLQPLTPLARRTGLFASVALVAIIVVLGLRPNILFEAANGAAFGMIDNSLYSEAVGLEIPQS